MTRPRAMSLINDGIPTDRTVRLDQIAATPAVYVATCPCGAKTEEVGDQVYAVQLWQAHAEQAGHEGDFALMVVNLDG